MVQIGVGDRFLAIILLSMISYKLMSLSMFLLCFTAIIAFWIWYEFDVKQHWHKLGIPGPIDNIFIGSILKIGMSGLVDYEKKNYAKYGQSFGSYMFDRPNYNTMDLGFLRRVYIKDFMHFQNRFIFLDPENENMQDSLFRNMITVKREQEWRRIRNRVTPAFTSGKLKKLLPTLNLCTKQLCENIEKKFIVEGKELPLKDLFGRLVLGEIARGGFSLDVDTFKDGEDGQEDLFVQKVKEAFGTKWKQYFFFFLTFCPGILHYLEKYFHWDAFSNSAEPYFIALLEQLYAQRKADPNSKEKYNDIFQILMNAVEEGEEGEAVKGIDAGAMEEEDAEIIHKELLSAKCGKHLTKLELLAQSFILLIAGYETTGSTLHFVIYLLATFPEIQERLREEINEIMGDEEEVGYEHLRKMHYLKAVVQETLRMFPLAPITNRECSEDVNIDGVQLHRGDMVSLPIYAIHHSELFYEEPEKFDPERFMPEQKAQRDPITFLAFGLGPRNCIGMRLAEFQMHVALALLVRRFRFFPGPKTEKFPPKILSINMLKPKEPLLVLAEKI